MAGSTTCSTREVIAPDGTAIPVPVGGLGLSDGSSADIAADAQVQINVNTNADGDVVGYYVVVNNAPESGGETAKLFGELAQETAIEALETLATKAFTTVAPIAIKGAGLVIGVLTTLLTPSHLTREVFIRSNLDTGQETDGPPVTYCLLLEG